MVVGLVSAAREYWIWIWPVFRDGNCPLRRDAACVTVLAVLVGDRRVI
jgi:hypothetical protein